MAGLHQPDGAIAASVQVRRKIPQHFIRVLIPFVDHGCKVALGVKHDGISIIPSHIPRN